MEEEEDLRVKIRLTSEKHEVAPPNKLFIYKLF